MKTYQLPEKSAWEEICTRPGINQQALENGVREIMEYVRRSGDLALQELTRRFDSVILDDFFVREGEMDAAENEVAQELKAAIQLAAKNIERFHSAQANEVTPIETTPGVTCWRKSLPIERVGLYIPGGTAPLFSTLLMLGIPAQLAGCPEIILCTPANQQGKVHPAILYTARLLGLTRICKLGGAQAVAAMAYGTESVPRVDKIFGPGNQYVTMAKVLAQQAGVAIDMPAGPSELLVIADASANPAFIAADLLSQAEHGADSQVILVSDSAETIAATLAEVTRQVAELPRRDTAEKALASSKAVLLPDLATAMAFSNAYAPEHLILATESPLELAADVRNAGSVFLGAWTPESVGDYASGTNHTLPTNGAARAYSGVSLDSFTKQITFQQLTPQGIQAIGPAVEIMAEAEQLRAHAQAVTLRLRALETDAALSSTANS